MCGIVGYVGHQNAVPILIEGLHRLEYRGYDSAGLALQRKNGIDVHKRQGKVREMEATPAEAVCRRRRDRPHALGDARRAERRQRASARGHGRPHRRGPQRHHRKRARVARATRSARHRVRVRNRYRSAGATDCERSRPIRSKTRCARRCASITGTYGIAVMDARHPEQIVVARNGSPVILGIGDNEMFIASDASALVRHTQQAIYLDDGEIAVVEARGVSRDDARRGAGGQATDDARHRRPSNCRKVRSATSC